MDGFLRGMASFGAPGVFGRAEDFGVGGVLGNAGRVSFTAADFRLFRGSGSSTAGIRVASPLAIDSLVALFFG